MCAGRLAPRFAALLLFVSVFSSADVGQQASDSDMAQKLRDYQRAIKQYRRQVDAHLAPVRSAVYGLDTIGADAIVEAHEMKELDLRLLADTLDDPRSTMLGRWYLQRATVPVADKKTICARQQTVKNLVEQEAVLKELQSSLARVAKKEKDLYSYWMPDELSGRSQGLLFNAPHIPFLYDNVSVVRKGLNRICSFLNNQRFALEAAWAVDAGKSLSFAAATFGIKPLLGRYFTWSIGYDSGDFDSWKELKDGMMQPFRSFVPVPHMIESAEQYKKLRDLPVVVRQDGSCDAPSIKLFGDVVQKGSWYDRYVAFVHGMRDEREIKGGGPLKVASDTVAALNSPSDDPSLLRKAYAFSMASGFSVAYGWLFLMTASSIRENWKKLFITANDLRSRVAAVASAVSGMKDAVRTAISSGAFVDETFSERAHLALAGVSNGTLKKLMNLLATNTFKGKPSLFYFRGRVLRAHCLLKQAKDELLPLMRIAGEIDAHCSMAKLHVSHASHNARYCFVDFDESQARPVIELDEFWTPLLESDLVFLLPEGVVTNAIKIGGNAPTNMLFTGPNGGGKSTVLKSVGHAVMLAHSWGIAPAAGARMSFMDGLRCCLDPREDLSRGVSKFMGSKYGMERLNQFMRSSGAPAKTVMLIDEPYAGTVDDEMARRTSQFCDDVASVGNGIAVIATHVKPVFNSGNRFGFYHVGIKEMSDGSFACTYKIQPGLCNWWFDDASRRRRYIDWLNPVPCLRSSSGALA